MEYLSPFPRDSPIIVTTYGNLLCTKCDSISVTCDSRIILEHSWQCPTVELVGELGPCKFGQALYERGNPCCDTVRGAECMFDWHLIMSTYQETVWAGPSLPSSRVGYEKDINLVLKDFFDKRPYVAEQALIKSRGNISDAKQWYQVWMCYCFAKPEREEFVGICMALEPLEFTPYVTNWILEWLLPFAFKNEVEKLRIIERVYASCARVREARIKN